jgi:hypothetical protein
VQRANYRDHDDLLDKLAFYLERDAIRERIPAAGRAEAIAKHTYAHRMEKVLKDVQDALSKSTIPLRWVKRSATHQDRGHDGTRIDPSAAGIGGQERLNGSSHAVPGGLA